MRRSRPSPAKSRHRTRRFALACAGLLSVGVVAPVLGATTLPGVASAATVVTGPTDLGTLVGFASSEAVDVNDAGQVVGTSCTTGDTLCHTFLWTHADGIRDLHTLPGYPLTTRLQ